MTERQHDVSDEKGEFGLHGIADHAGISNTN
jgi:hypothetical protein